MVYKKKYRYARKYRQQSSQQALRDKAQQTKGEAWGLLRKLLGMFALASLLGRNRN